MAKTTIRLAAVAALVAAALALTGAPLQAYPYSPPGPTGVVSIRRPSIGQQFELGPGERFTAVEMWLDGEPVTPAWEPDGWVHYTPLAPLSPGEHRVRLRVQVDPGEVGYYYEPQVVEWGFTVAADAVPDLPPPDAEAQRALDHLNRVRAAAGLPPVTYSRALGAAAAGHARYLAANGDHGHRQRLGAPHFIGEHPWDRARSFGYSGGTGEVIGPAARAEEAIAGWLATPYHRGLLLHPGVTEIGYGQAGGHGGRRFTVMTGGPFQRRDQVVLYPYPGQTGVPTGWSGLETPDPLRLYPGTTGPVGYTLSVTFAGAPERLTLTEARLTGPGDAAVPVMTLSPANDPEMTDTAALLPYRPLAPDTLYTVTMAGTVDWGEGPKPWRQTWSFRTGGGMEPLLRHARATWQRASQGARLVVEGAGFRPDLTIFLGGLPVRNLQVEGEGRLSFDLPSGFAGGRAPLLVVTPDGQEALWADLDMELPANGAGPAFTPATVAIQGPAGPETAAARVHGNGAALVPADILSRLGGQMHRVPDLDRFYWTLGGRTGDVTLNRAVAWVDGQPLILPLPVQMLDGELHVPVAFVEALTGSSLTVLRDIQGHWAEPFITQLVAAGVVSGYGDGTFRPEAPLTRAAFLKMLVAARGLPLQPGAAGGFADAAGHWVAEQGYLGAAATAGYVDPAEYPGGRFDPDWPITREEIAVMVVRALGLEPEPVGSAAPGNDLAAFVDASSWSRPGYVAAAVREGIVVGYQEADGRFSFRPRATATRAEAAVMLVRMLQRLDRP